MTKNEMRLEAETRSRLEVELALACARQAECRLREVRAAHYGFCFHDWGALATAFALVERLEALALDLDRYQPVDEPVDLAHPPGGG